MGYINALKECGFYCSMEYLNTAVYLNNYIGCKVTLNLNEEEYISIIVEKY